MKLKGIDVLDTGKKIQNWMIQMEPKTTIFNQVTERLFDVISRVTGEENINIQDIIFVGIGRAMIKYNNEVLFLLLHLHLYQYSLEFITSLFHANCFVFLIKTLL